jgi:Icc-related predicted phosphoesterase
MSLFYFVSDLHGRRDRFHRLFQAALVDRPRAVLIGGDLLPSVYQQRLSDRSQPHGFIGDFVVPQVCRLKEQLGEEAPRFFVILGNDDARTSELEVIEAARHDVWHYLHGSHAEVDGYQLYGYSYVPPTPFQLKDWERYDVSRYVDPGCLSPEEGYRTVPVPAEEARFRTINQDLAELTQGHDLSTAVFLFHSPPHGSKLDRADLDGKMVDHVPLDVHVGSIAIQQLITERQPLLTLHGHVHESARLTGSWRERIGRTHAFSAAHDGPELALVRFDPADLDSATRELL